MKNRKTLYLLLGLIGSILVLAAAAAIYFEKAKPKPVIAANTSPHSGQSAAGSPPGPEAAVSADSGGDVAWKVTNFLGSLPPGGNAESAGKERTYVVSYQVAFFRKTPSEKVAEEGLTYKQLQQRDEEAMPPYVYYGENVVGKYDPAQPGSIAARINIDRQEVRGFIDAGKLWLEPPLQRAESDRYMALKDGTSVHVVPDPSTSPVLTLLQGEMVETVGRLDFQGQSWVKARFNATGRPRYGFISGRDVKALTASSVNESSLSVEEIPQRTRYSKVALSDAERQRLAQTGFYIEPVPLLDSLSVDDMADSYQRSGPQVFITSDLYLHSFHLIFDRMLQDVEEKKFFPAVAKMAGNLARTADNQLWATSSSAPQLHDALLTDLLYFSVAARLFDPAFPVSEAVKPQVEALVPVIQAGGGELPSTANFLGLTKEDFTPYKVRGHYEKNETLQRYFRGMMWFGRRSFLLSDKNETLAAILMPSLVDEAQERHRFESLDALITYLIGRQDKYTVAGYRTVNRKVFGTETPGIPQLTTNLDDNIAGFQKIAANEIPAPQIVSVQTGIRMTQEERLRQTAAFKFLGQRYVLDAFILNQLTSPSVGTNDNPRNLPSALDVMMLLGSKPATDLQLQSQKEHRWANYESQIAKLKKTSDEQLSRRSTFYEQWLYAVKTLFMPTASKQLFALGEPWQYKNLNSGLASWSELKHDTILYAEQSTAEQGEGDEFEIPSYVPPRPKGYVEPNPAFFAQLTQSVDQILTQLKSAGFATDEYVDKFTLFRELAHQAETISHKEVAGEAITAEDYEWIDSTRWAFDRTLLLPRDIDSIPDPSYLQMALVADVATDAVQGRVLEDGIGTPQKIVVAVKDASGGTRLTVGYVYSWFEFDSTKRWSDTEWKKVIYSKEENAKALQGIKLPSWYSLFLKKPGGTP